MTKRQFLNSLKKELNIFSEEKKKEIYEKYKKELDDKIKKCKTEEAAIKKMGSISKIVDKELENIRNERNKTKTKKESNETKIKNIVVETAKDFINSLGKVFKVNSNEELVKLLTEVCITLLLIALLEIPFFIFKEIGVGIFKLFPNILSGLFSIIWSFIIQVLYFGTSLYMIYVIVKKVVLKDNKELESIKEDKKDIIEDIKNSTKNHPRIDIFKSLLFIISLPLYFIDFLLVVLLGIVIGFMFKGIIVIGLLLVVISLLIIFSSIIAIVNKMIFKGELS